MFNKKESSSLEHNKCGIDGLVSKPCGKENDKCIISKYLLTKYLLEKQTNKNNNQKQTNKQNKTLTLQW